MKRLAATPALALLAAALLAGAPAHAGTADRTTGFVERETAATPQQAGEVVTISGSTTGYARLVLPRPATLQDPSRAETRDAVRIDGGGRFAAIALVGENNGPTIIGGHTAATRELGDQQGEFLLDVAPGRAPSAPFQLPAGEYRLYLLTDGQPTTATLRFTGLSGTTTNLVPHSPAELLHQGGMPKASGDALFSEGHAATLTGPTLHFKMLLARHTAHAATSSSSCFFDHEPAGPNPYLPGCTSTAGRSVWLHNVDSQESLTPSAAVSWGGAYIAESGPFASGVALVSAALVEGVDYQHLWLTL